jgi:exonuclease III
MKLLTWNIEGLKIAIELLTDSFFEECDIIIFTETFLLKEWTTKLF